MIGQQLGHYKIVDRLGAGGMSEVYRAEDLELGRQVALKVLPEKVAVAEARLERFRREARTLAALDHPNIVTIYSVESAEGMPFLTMQLVEGRSLQALIRKVGMQPGVVLEIAVPLADALAEAHDRGVVHRDLKPSNVLIDRRDQVKVLDFGLAKLQDSEPLEGQEDLTDDALTSEGMVMGTLPYMSPEQVTGKTVDQRSDIFSLGSVLYEMVSGERPFKGESSAHLIAAILRDKALPLNQPDLPPRLRLLIERCHTKSRKKRYQSAHEVRRELAAIQRELVSGSAPVVTSSSGSAPMSGSHGPPSIAVLPFARLTSDPDTEFFSEGLAEDLINALTKIDGLRVPAHTSSVRFDVETGDLREIGRKLGVETILQGSVRRSGSRVRISAKLVDVAEGVYLWSESYDRDLDDIFVIQDEVSRAIVDKLEVELASSWDSGPIRQSTASPEAYEHYLKGRFYWNRRDQGGLEKALEHFQTAVEVDPEYALAHVGLADGKHILAMYSLVPPVLAIDEAMSEVDRALEIDPDLGEAYATRGALWIPRAEWANAEMDLKRAIELAPSYAYARALMAHLRAVHGRRDEMEEQIRIMLELEPDSQYLHGLAALVRYFATDRAGAIEMAKKGLGVDPASFMCRWVLGVALIDSDRVEEGIEHLEALAKATDRLPLIVIFLGYAYGRAEEVEKALAVREELERRAAEQYIHPIAFALVHSGLGEHEEAKNILLDSAKQGMPSNWVPFFKERMPELYAFYGLPFPY